MWFIIVAIIILIMYLNEKSKQLNTSGQIVYNNKYIELIILLFCILIALIIHSIK